MDLVRFGAIIRALRRRRGWRQLDLALACDASQDTVSVIERGHGDRLAFATLLRVASALDARLRLEVRWRGGELDRLLDRDHADIAARFAQILQNAGWQVEPEVTYAVYGQTGSIDVLAWHEASRSLLVTEIKTEVTSGEATVRKLDEKARLAGGIALERFGWRPASVSRLLVVEDTTTARRRVTVGSTLFALAFPSRAVAVRGWLRSPSGTLSGLVFLPHTNQQRGMSRCGGRHRVRRRPTVARRRDPSVAGAKVASGSGVPEVTVLTNRS